MDEVTIPSAAGNERIAGPDWNLTFQVLGDLLKKNAGSVSYTAFRRELERNHHIEDARPLLDELKFFNAESSSERGIPAPSFKFRHMGRSFYSEERYQKEIKELEAATTKEADAASREAEVVEPVETTESRSSRQEEARLVVYVKSALEELYASDELQDDRPYVFDVHSSRSGGSFENVDLIAVHWRPHNVCDLVTVEVKLEFTARAVQQALNYTRFSHRVWVAVLVETDSMAELRERNPSLFEFAISRGLGLLACRRRQGRRYDVFPIHWPLRSQLDAVEEEEFKERYRTEFEEAGIVETKKRQLPRLR